MPYRSRQAQREAERRYEASPRGKAMRRARNLAKRKPAPFNPAPLAQAITEWRTQ